MGNSRHKQLRGQLLILALLGLAVCMPSALRAQTVDPEKEIVFEWVPPAASNTDQVVDPSAKRLDIIITPTPKATADVSNFTKRYIIDLKKFNISNDGTNPVETSKGINAALQDAGKSGANYIVFPRGTYLISELDPIVLNIQNAIIDLNGATLQINTNGLRKYLVATFNYGAENLRLTNGTLRGDKDTHDYTAGGEWGTGLRVESGKNLEIDHMTFTNFMGDGVSTGTGMLEEGKKRRFYYLRTENLEQGGFSEDGKTITTNEKTRTIEPYDITVTGGEFELGYTAGYMGFPYVKGRAYQVYYYTDDMKFISKSVNYQYKKTKVPAGAKWVHLEFNQPEVLGLGSDGSIPTITKPYYAFISDFKSPVDVHFHDNHVVGNRRLGMAYCGGQRWVIENNLFEANGGTAPGFGVDFEDGWLMMQDVVFRNNKFKDNIKGDLVVCGGSEFLFEGNVFEKGAHFWAAALSFTFQNNVIKGGGVSFKTRTGHITTRDNLYENCTILIFFDARDYNNGFYRKPDDVVRTPSVHMENETLVNVSRVSGTYFDFTNSKFKDVLFQAGEDTKLARFKDSVFENTTLSFGAKGPEVLVDDSTSEGTLKLTGEGLSRRKNSQ